MFRLIRIDFYDDFSCLMSRCSDNCCDEEWDIYIDDETIEKYEKLGVADLYAKITRDEPHKLIKHEGKCPFITPEGLCIFHRDYGEDFLSNTCRSYPRFASAYGEDIYLETLGMSCPATVTNVMEMKDPASFPAKVYYEDESEKGNNPPVSVEETIARRTIGMFLPCRNVIKTYLELFEEYRAKECMIKNKEELVDILVQNTVKTPSERYVRDLFEGYDSGSSTAPAFEDKALNDIEDNIASILPLFLCNVNRIWLFEHVMLGVSSNGPDITDILKKGLATHLLLLMSIECSIKRGNEIDREMLNDCTYKVMRILDHGGEALEKLAV